ncbi:MAG: radical SAM protein [Marinilabiliales bacterium]
MKLDKSILNKQITNIIGNLVKSKALRNLLEGKLEHYIKQKIINDDTNASEVAKYYEYLAIWSMYKSYIRNLDRGYISSEVTNKIINTFISSVMLRQNIKDNPKQNYYNRHGVYPPTFLTVSPTKKCNLKCIGCYASSSPAETTTLEWNYLDKIIEDTYTNMGMRFFVISGGEPLMYKSQEKTILDLAEKWNDCFFLMFTNGTLISKKIAERIAQLGNITLAFSIEGYEEETDARRGKGIYKKLNNGKNHLQTYGIPFGFSVTATKNNINLLTDESFYDYFFNTEGATFMWVFHYMPIGRNFTKDLMITPQERLNLQNIQDRMIKEKQYFIADFWNNALMSNGCISCGTRGGYFYINWEGNIMPCVFVPYYHDNVKTLYNNGKTIEHAMFSPLFVRGREWQKNYIGDKNNPGNLLTPCFIRDHYANFKAIATETYVNAENKEAYEALNSDEYYKAMVEFDNELSKLSKPVWEKIIENTKFIKIKSHKKKEKIMSCFIYLL